MPDKDAGTPRIFLARHGPTEWSQSGAYTSHTELPLLDSGSQLILDTAPLLIGRGKLVDPTRLAKVYISPRKRAGDTYALMFKHVLDADPKDKKVITNDIREWEYGLYEGLKTAEIRKGRKERGLDGHKDWDIWTDGCEEGESPAEVTVRLDKLLHEIRELQRPYMHGEENADVLIVAHGHILRAFTKRFLGYSLPFPLSMMLEPGAVGVLSYQHHCIDEPAFLLGSMISVPTTG
ncbi:MAG: hypothetical protein MMC33_000917 [Icmadophila ericetorum]|nr:hypothetical protein [Icmadophila ericetorum]